MMVAQEIGAYLGLWSIIGIAFAYDYYLCYNLKNGQFAQLEQAI